jgi:hypothetical protein
VSEVFSGASWRKLGLVYQQGLAKPWMASHGANPVAGETTGSVVRVYFNARDAERRSHICWCDVDFSAPLVPKAIAVSDEPVLAPGERGAFDDSGCSMGCLVQNGEETWLYYLGWNLNVTVPWHNSIGLAVRRTGQTRFERYSAAPVLDRSTDDPLTVSYPWILREGGVWRMWYGSHVHWGGEHEFLHELRYAESSDGVQWQPQRGALHLPMDANEYAPSKPSVLRLGETYHMWFSNRGESYRIYHAVSSDGFTWQRQPQGPALDVSAAGWDSQMTCYPCVFEHAGRHYMLYCGNGYGADGFGIAIAE